MDFEVARALAGLGRLPEALAVVARHRDGPTERRRGYLGQVVSVYGCALDFDGALRAARENVELAPDDAAPRIDLAMQYALHFHDAASARAELERLGSGELSQLAEGARRLVLGIVLAEEGSWLEAQASLDAAHGPIAKVAPTAGWLELASAYRAWAKAGLGRPVDAARELSKARPLLDASDGGLITRYLDSRIEELSRRP